MLAAGSGEGGSPMRAPGWATRGMLAMLATVTVLAMGAARAGERGSPPIQVYDAQQLGGAHISSDLVTLPDGRLLVVNMYGLMQFDGVRWTVTRHPRELGGMQHLSLAPDGRIFTSVDGDVGYFQRAADGSLAWHSLLDRLALGPVELGKVAGVDYDAAAGGLWIATYGRIAFVPDDEALAVRHLALDQPPIFAAPVGADYWIQQPPDYSLMRVVPRDTAQLALEAVVGAEQLRGNLLFDAAEGPDDVRLLTTHGRLLRAAGGELHPWTDALVPILSSANPRSILRLADGRHAIGSLLGLHLVDADGVVVEHYDAEDGLPGQRRMQDLALDRDGDLWLAQDRSIVRVSLARGISVHDESRGLPSATDATRWGDTIYASSVVGVFRMRSEKGPGGGRFEQVLPTLRDTRALAPLDATYLLAASGGIHAITRDGKGELHSELIADFAQTVTLETSRFVPGRVWATHITGVVRIDRIPDGRLAVTPVAGIDEAYLRVAELDADTLWLGHRVEGVLRVDVTGALAPRRYGVDDGLPPGQVRIFSGPHGVWFTTTQGLRVHDAASDRFVVPPNLPPELSRDRLFSVHEDAQRNLWVRGGAIGNDVFWKQGDQWTADGALLFTVDPAPTIVDFFREGDVVWAIRANGLLRIDLAQRQPLTPPPAPMLTQVHDLRARLPLALDTLASLPPSVRDVRFDFAHPLLHRPEATQFRSRLRGYDEWTDWSGRDGASRVYTNLPDGDFTLEIEARDSLLRFAPASQYPIVVTAPWWRSTPATIGYMLAALALLWLAGMAGSRRRGRAMLARQRELEDVVAQRTQTLATQNTQLEEQALRLREVDELKTRFFVNVGHEFRTPLTLVMGPLDDVLRDPRTRLGDRTREQLELANRNARRVLDLIVELLDVNRLEHGQWPMRREKIALAPLLQRLAQDSQALADRHGHTLHFESAAPLPLVDADAAQIERVVANLIGNACKYCARGGRIELSLDAHEDGLRIRVRDDGRGIASDALPHVFDRFFRASGGDADGYGVGLALCREIVERHGGRISVQSAPGAGSTFAVWLPGADTIATPAHGISVPTQPASHSDPNPARPADAVARERALVLVVDDHADLRLRVRQLLESRYRVAEACDGPGAIEQALALQPDVIVSDVMMPGFDGVELSRRLRAHPDTNAIALLLLTAKAGSEHAVAGLHAGADDYLAKPFDAAELLARIDALLGRAHRLRQQAARAVPPTLPPAAREQRESQWFEKLHQIVHANLHRPEFGVDELAAAMHLDRSALFRRMKGALEVAPADHLREQRLLRARSLLESKAGNVTEVAYAVGFESLSSFARAYRSRFSEAPSATLNRAGAA